ncbi:MAG: cell wall hydrolase [Bacteroidota bacterium]
MPRIGKNAAMTMTVVLAALLPLLTLAFSTSTSDDELAQTPLPTAMVSDAVPAFDPAHVSDDVLWLARCIYSETKREYEQDLVAWVVRNRVETSYRGRSTYEGVVLDPYQFSAFNPGSSKRRLFTTLTPASNSASFQQALEVAHNVYYAPSSERPFPKTTRHFYSEQSMVGRRAPRWAEGERPVTPVRHRVDPKRFRFYSGLASVLM